MSSDRISGRIKDVKRRRKGGHPLRCKDHRLPEVVKGGLPEVVKGRLPEVVKIQTT